MKTNYAQIIDGITIKADDAEAEYFIKKNNITDF